MQTPQEIKADADELFDKGFYAESYNKYNQITGTFSRDYDWNFRYGASLLYASHDKQKAIGHLGYAVKSPSIDKRAYYFLGRAYHLNYQFKEAQQYYEKFRDQASSGQLKEFDVNAQLNGCKFGRKLLTNVTDLIVMEKKEINEESFYDLYDLSNIGGTILVTDEFGTKYDKKVGHRSVIHFPKNSPNVFYSSYGEDGSTGLDIYQKKKLPDGSYSLPQKIRGECNTDLDEDYAYMHPNGQYLYFCSKGHNSMGGYDVFRSVYDPKKDSFGPPENLDFAISSPDDDIMYIVDSLDRTAFFASRRESKGGKLFVYEVRVERIQMQIAAIKGAFENTIVPSNKEVNIEIEDFSSGSQIGSFNSKTENGDYFLTFPKGGKYKYYITVKGSDVTHYAVVEIPMLKELRPLKQKISLLRDDSGEQYVKIENLFDEAFDDPVTVMAQIYQELSKLNPNAEKFDLDSLNAMKSTDDILVKNGLDAFSTKSDVEKVLTDKIEDLNEDIAQDKENSNIAYNLAEEKSDLANEKMVELNKLMADANTTSDPNEKKDLMEDAFILNKEIKNLNTDAKNLIDLGKELDKSIIEKEIKVNQATKVLDDVKKVEDGNKVSLAQTVSNNSEFFVENVKDRSVKPDLIEEIVRAGNDNTKEANKINSELIELKNQEKALQENLQSLENKLENTKKSKDKAAIEDQILAVKSDLESVNTSISAKEKQYDALINNDIDTKAGLVSVASEVSDDKYNNSIYSNDLSDDNKSDISNKVKTNDLSANIEAVDKTLAENGAGSKVDLFASDEQRSNYTFNQWSEDIDKEIKKLRDDLNTTPVDKQGPILEEIQEFENLKVEKANELEVVTTNPDDIKAVVELDEVVDGWKEKKAGVNGIVDPLEKANASLKLNNEVKNEIAKERKDLVELLKANPGSKNIEERIENLDKIEAEIDQEILRDKDVINQNSGIKDPEEILADFDSGYKAKVTEIYKNKNESERIEAVKELNSTVVEAANERIQELDAILENDPTNELALKEKKDLVKFKEDIELNLDKPIVAPVTYDPENIVTKVEPSQIIEDYESKKKAIDGISNEFDRKKASNDLDQELTDNIRKEIKDLTALSNENPGNKDIKKRLDNLKSLDDQINKNIVSNENWMKENPKVGTSEIAEVTDVNPNYQNKMVEINELDNDKDKNKAIKALNDETINAIDTRINIIENELKSNPNTPDFNELTNEKSELNNLKNQIKENPDKALIDPSQVEQIDTNPEIGDVLPSFQSDLAEIEQSSATAIEKERAKVKLNNALVNKIDLEVERLNQLKIERPDDSEKINERIKTLEALKNQAQNEVADSEQKINEILNSTAQNPLDDIKESDLVPVKSANDIDNTYDSKLLAITNSSESLINKEKSKINLNRDLILKIDSELSKLESLKSAKPEWTDKIDERITSLKELKDEKEGEIETSENAIENAGGSDVITNPNEINEVASIDQIDPDYKNKLDNINLALQDDITKEQNKVKLNKSLISKIDQEINQLNNLKSSNPELSSKIDKRIESLNNIKKQKQGEIAISENTISQSTAERPEITIATLMPNYEGDLAAIKSETDITETDRLEGENDLHTDLIKAIDRKISSLQNEWEENDELGAEITLELDKLEELKESLRDEIAKNNTLLEKMGENLTAENKSVGDITPDDFNSETGKEVLADNAGNINEIKELKSEIETLEVQLENADNDKDKSKIQSEIDKKKLKLARVENEVIADLGNANDAEYENEKKDLKIDAIVATANNMDDPDIIDANNKLKEADVLMSEADDLRAQAENEKDPIKANNLLTDALDKENKAKSLTDQANRIFKAARVVDNFNKDEQIVVTEVPENVEDRSSTQLTNQATDLDLQANALADRSANLRDSANTVKKKYKEAIIIEADKLDQEASVLREESTKLKNDAKEIKEQEDELLAVQIKGPSTNPSNEVTDEIATSTDYKEFYEANKSANENLEKATDIGNQIEQIQANQKRKIKSAVVTYQDGGSIENALNDDPEIKSDQEKIDSLKTLQKEYKDLAVQDMTDANNILDRAGSQVKDDMISLANNNVNPREKVIVPTTNPLDADFSAPTELASDIFRKTDGAVYGDDKKIPLDQKTKGLVYKVQVGAFRKPLPPDHFKDFAPVSGEQLGNGITRYMAGYFTKEATANDARGQIRGIGYGDAFVVAYCNGVKISMREAREIEAGRVICEGTVSDENFTNNGNTNNTNTNNNNTTNNNNNNNNNTNNNTNANNTSTSNSVDNGNAVIQPNNTEEENLVSYYTSVPGAAKANQVEIIKGLFFTVQIGVYTKPVKPAVLFNIQPLNSQKLPNGNVRYSTGMFTSVPSATVRKDETVQLGVTDAFVTAYFNGERITLAEANQLLQEQGPEVLFNSASNKDANFAGSDNTNTNNNPNTNNVDTTNTDNTDTNNVNTNNVDTTSTTNSNNVDTSATTNTNVPENKGLLADQNTEDLGPPYRINLGYFSKGVPVDFTDLLLDYQNEGILSISDIEDNVLYYVGTYESKSGAEARMKEMKAKGFKNAEVVSLKPKEVVENEDQYYPDGVYYRILMGRFKNEVPGEYATLLIETEDLIETEEDVEGTIYFLSTKLSNLDDIEARLKEFADLGFEEMEIVSYYLYSAIPMLQAEKILKGEPIGKLQRYEFYEGVNADPYLYNKEAIYFHIEVGRFVDDVPGDFTKLLFDNKEENILREETFDEELVFFSENTYSYTEAEEIKTRLIGKGFVNAEIKAFHKYDNISIKKAKQILGIE